MLITDKNELKKYTITKHIWCGIPSIEVTKKGRTFLTFYSGGTIEWFGNYVLLIKSDDGVNFSDPIAVCYAGEDHRCFDPCLWIDPLGRLWFTWSKNPDAGLFAAICEDPDADEIVFGEEFFIGNNVMMNKPTVLSTGEWAFPIAVWHPEVTQAFPLKRNATAEPGAYAYITADQGKTFRKSTAADVKNRCFDEHMFLELENGVLRVFVRTNNGIGACDSYDGGLHWGKSFDTGYGGPNSRFHIRRQPSGRILLINHDNFKGRNNLTAMLSEDDGKTFPYKLLLDERDNVSYPDSVTTPDGKIHITYDHERGNYRANLQDALSQSREILTACITEEDIINGSIVSEGSYLKRVCYKLTSYDGEDKNPFHEKELYTSEEYAEYLKTLSDNPEDIIAELFCAYKVNCTNIHNIDAENLDKLIDEFSSTRDMKILNNIIELIRGADFKTEKDEKNIVDEICKYIIDNLENDFTTESIAEKFHYSSHYIRHIFKEKTGTSIIDFKNSQRIKKAKILLRSKNCKITDVASACGFDSHSYFTELFIKNTGLSPVKYRNLVQKLI